jgi:hypothetical protein
MMARLPEIRSDVAVLARYPLAGLPVSAEARDAAVIIVDTLPGWASGIIPT